MIINVNTFNVKNSEAIQLCSDYNLTLLSFEEDILGKERPSLLIRGNETDIFKFKLVYFKDYSTTKFIDEFVVDKTYKEIMQENFMIKLNRLFNNKHFFEIVSENDLKNNITAYRIQFYNQNEKLIPFYAAINNHNLFYLLINDFNVIGLHLVEIIDKAEIELEGLQKLYDEKMFMKIDI